MLLPLFCQCIRQPQNYRKRRGGVVPQPDRTELQDLLTACDRAEHHPRKSQGNGCFACQTHSKAHCHEMHHRLTTHIKLSDRWLMGWTRKICKHPVAKYRPTFGLPKDELLTAKRAPGYLFSSG